MKLKPFQEKLVFQGIPGKMYSLQQNLDIALSKGKKQIIAFQSPTGTGKTVMLSKLIDFYRNQEVSFVWVGPSDGGLVFQSLDKVNKLVQLGLIFEDLSTEYIPQGQVLFIGWSQVNRISSEGFESKIMNNESKDLPQVISNTRSKRKLVVIVDESHIGATKPSNSKEVLNTVFKADVEIHISATNTSLDFADYTTIVTQEMRDEIIDSGIIKKELKMGQLGVQGNDARKSHFFCGRDEKKS